MGTASPYKIIMIFYGKSHLFVLSATSQPSFVIKVIFNF